MKTNTKTRAPVAPNHEGIATARLSPEKALRRSVLSCMLWESEFYEDGVAIADRIVSLANEVDLPTLSALAIEAREKFNLRHAPLLLADAMLARRFGSKLVGDTIARVIQRADEMGELIALYQKRAGKEAPLPAQLKRGVAEAFTKFDEYQLGKYDREAAVRLRDVMFLTHPKPKDGEQAALWAKLADRNVGVATPDTWEVALSGGADKRETFERLIRENRLPYMALLRNLRKMVEVGVDRKLVEDAITGGNARRILPWRFVAAARVVPQLEPALDRKLLAVLADIEPLPGETLILVDTSPSMNHALSGKSDLTRMDAAATLASIWPGRCRVFAFSTSMAEVPPRKGMAGIDAIVRAVPRNGTLLGAAVHQANAIRYDRLVVLTDEESQDAVGAPLTDKPAYMVNLASYGHAVGHGPWTRIEGFSEQVLRFIAEHERESAR
jgi:60 kDa SS-A/Ro ribonucleoprotein